MNIKRLKVTTTYHLGIEGYIKGKFYDTVFNRWYIVIKLSNDFGCYKKGHEIAENIQSVIFKNSLKFGQLGKIKSCLGVGKYFDEIPTLENW